MVINQNTKEDGRVNLNPSFLLFSKTSSPNPITKVPIHRRRIGPANIINKTVMADGSVEIAYETSEIRQAVTTRIIDMMFIWIVLCKL